MNFYLKILPGLFFILIACDKNVKINNTPLLYLNILPTIKDRSTLQTKCVIPYSLISVTMLEEDAIQIIKWPFSKPV